MTVPCHYCKDHLPFFSLTPSSSSIPPLFTWFLVTSLGFQDTNHYHETVDSDGDKRLLPSLSISISISGLFLPLFLPDTQPKSAFPPLFYTHNLLPPFPSLFNEVHTLRHCSLACVLVWVRGMG